MADLPKSKKWLVDGFCWYSWRLLQKHFDAWYLDASNLTELAPSSTTPIIVYANHPGWWDPIVAMLLRERLFPKRQFYAPIDAVALENYRVMASLGFYGLDLSSRKGAVSFLQTSSEIVRTPNTTLWITPEGQFADPRDNNNGFQPGLAHLVHRMVTIEKSSAQNQPVILPLALEYPFWNERRPVVLSRFGAPVNSDDLLKSKTDCQTVLQEQLRRTQNELEIISKRRDANDYDQILKKEKKRRTAYDVFRQIKSALTGRKFQLSHDIDQD